MKLEPALSRPAAIAPAASGPLGGAERTQALRANVGVAPAQQGGPAPPAKAPRSALARLVAYGVDAEIAKTLLGPQVLYAHPLARPPLGRAELADAIGAGLAELARRSGATLTAEQASREAAVLGCTLVLARGGGAARCTTALGRKLAEVFRHDVGLYASEESSALIVAAATRASRGWTHGQDCFFHSVGSILGRTPSDVGAALNYHTHGYRSWGRAGTWPVAEDLDRLGVDVRRLGQAFSDIKFGQVRILPDEVGFHRADGDPIDNARAAMAATPIGTRMLVGIHGHYLHAVHAKDGVHFLDSQTLSGRTLVVPLQVLRANADKFPGVQVTVLLPRDGAPVHTPAFVKVSVEEFLRDCPFAWERT